MIPPGATLQRLTDPIVEPLSLASARKYLKVEFVDPDEDALIADMITAARLVCETEVDRSFIATTWRLSFTTATSFVAPRSFWTWPGVSVISLPSPPLIAVTSFGHRDLSGILATVDVSPGAGNITPRPGTPGQILPGLGGTYPFGYVATGTMEIEYTAGYGPNPTDVPRNIVQAIRMLTAHYYEHRSTQAEIPDAVVNLLGPSRWGGYC